MEEMVRYRSETEKVLNKGEFKCAYDREMIYLAIIGVILVVSLIVALPVILYIVGFMGRRGGADALAVMLIPFYLFSVRFLRLSSTDVPAIMMQVKKNSS